ncbi:hypothetical protein [Burkholderia stagnalis]
MNQRREGEKFSALSARLPSSIGTVAWCIADENNLIVGELEVEVLVYLIVNALWVARAFDQTVNIAAVLDIFFTENLLANMVTSISVDHAQRRVGIPGVS